RAPPTLCSRARSLFRRDSHISRRAGAGTTERETGKTGTRRNQCRNAGLSARGKGEALGTHRRIGKRAQCGPDCHRHSRANWLATLRAWQHCGALGAARPLPGPGRSAHREKTRDRFMIATAPQLASSPNQIRGGTELGCLRNFLSNRFVYVLVSPRAKGLSVGVNVNPDKQCNFNCAYCEVDRRVPAKARLDIDVMAAELQMTLASIASGGLLHQPPYQKLAPELAQLRHVALS